MQQYIQCCSNHGDLIWKLQGVFEGPSIGHSDRTMSDSDGLVHVRLDFEDGLSRGESLRNGNYNTRSVQNFIEQQRESSVVYLNHRVEKLQTR